jgi:hypothetical protein
VWLRINAADGGSDWVSVPLEMWRGHPSDVDIMWSDYHDRPRFDVSACFLRPDPEVFDYVAMPTTMFIDPEKTEEHVVTPGADVFLTGLFANHLGRRRNIPIMRCGNIAAMPDEPVDTRLGPMDALLIEARSIGGLSGSPVFVSLTGSLKPDGSYAVNHRWTVYLLGLIHGHWDARGGDTITDAADSGESINKGIAIVAPAHHILETIRQDAFMKDRTEAMREHRRGNGPVMDGL